MSEWYAGQLAFLDPSTGERPEWPLPDDQPMPYAVYTTAEDMILRAILVFFPIQPILAGNG